MIWWFVGSLLVVSFGLVALRGAPYVPTLRRQIEQALDLAQVGPRDLVVDLGSGDGVVLKMAAQRGARAVGYELNPVLCVVSWLRTWRCRGKVQIKCADMWRLRSLPADTTVVYVFATSRDIRKVDVCMRRWSAGRELKLVSYGFEIPGVVAERSSGAMRLYRYVG